MGVRLVCDSFLRQELLKGLYPENMSGLVKGAPVKTFPVICLSCEFTVTSHIADQLFLSLTSSLKPWEVITAACFFRLLIAFIDNSHY